MALSINNSVSKKPVLVMPSPAPTQQVQSQPAQPATLRTGIPGLLSPTAPLGSIGSTPVVSHTITTKPDGTTTHKVTHAPVDSGEESKQPNKETNTAPKFQVKFMNGEHHVPFKSADGSVKFINAKGEVSA